MGFLDTSARIRRTVIAELDLLPAENYRRTIAAGVAEFNVGDAFCSDETGDMVRYERIAAAPGYSALPDSATPLTVGGMAARGASKVGLARGSRVEDALNETISLMEFRTAAQKSAGLLPDTDAWDRASKWFRDNGKTGTLLLPPGILPLSRTVSFPVGVSLRGCGRRTVIQPTEGGVYINAFMIRLNSTGAAWEQQYPNTSSGTVSDLRITNTTSQNLRAIQFGGSYIFREIRFSGLGQGIAMVGVYCDFVELDRIFFEGDRAPDPAWGASGEHLINLGLGDALRVNAVHISGPSSVDRKVLRSFGCRGGVVQGMINGVLTLHQCVGVTVLGGHWEFGGVDVLDGNVTIADNVFFNMKGNNRVPIRLYSSNGVYGEVYGVKLSNNSFASTPDAAGYPVALTADVQVHSSYRVDIEDQARYVSKWNDISKHRRHGIVVAGSDGTLLEAFNGISAIASRSSTILNQRVIMERPMATGQMTVHTGINSPITLDGFAAWPLPTGTYYYQMQMVVDRNRFIAGTSQFGVNERSVALTNGGGVPQLNINDGSAAMPTIGWIARIYRGSASGVYSQYVDVPMVDSSALLDTGTHLNGFPWVDRTPGIQDSTNGMFGQVRYASHRAWLPAALDAARATTAPAWSECLPTGEATAMNGMDRRTGKPLGGADHIRQSIEDILGTPLGTRLGRRDYGSELPELFDQPMNELGRIRVFAATALAIMRQEKRARVSSIALAAGDAPGSFVLRIVGRRVDVAASIAALDLTIPVRAKSALAA